MFKRLIMLFALLLSISAFAFDLPKPSEVKAVYASGDYARAEMLLKQVMVERPTAPVHYQLGQVYSKQGKHKDALNEFRQAQALDPSLKFASSAAAFTRALADEQTIVAPQPITTSQPQHSQRQANSPNSGEAGQFFVILFLLLIAGAAIYGIYYLVTTIRHKKAIAQQADDELSKKNSNLLDLSKQLDDALLIAKTANYSEADKLQITQRITSLQGQVRSILADLKDGEDISAYRIYTVEANVREVIEQATNGLPVPVREDSIYSPKARRKNSSKNGMLPPAPPPPPAPCQVREGDKVVHPGAAPAYQSTPAPASAPVIVNNTSSGSSDLLTGMMIGEMMHSHRDNERTVYVEREVYLPPTRTSRIDTNDDDDTYTAPSRSSTLDTDNDRSDSYTTDSSSIDSSSTSGNDDSY